MEINKDNKLDNVISQITFRKKYFDMESKKINNKIDYLTKYIEENNKLINVTIDDLFEIRLSFIGGIFVYIAAFSGLILEKNLDDLCNMVIGLPLNSETNDFLIYLSIFFAFMGERELRNCKNYYDLNNYPSALEYLKRLKHLEKENGKAKKLISKLFNDLENVKNRMINKSVDAITELYEDTYIDDENDLEMPVKEYNK